MEKVILKELSNKDIGVKITDISEKNSCKQNIDRILLKEAEIGLQLLNVEVDRNIIIFTFGPFSNVRSEVRVEQYSVDIYPKTTIRQQALIFERENEGFKTKCIIGKKDFWLVVFLKNNQR